MMNKKFIILIGVIVLFLFSCNVQSPSLETNVKTNEIDTLVTGTPIPLPEKNKATVTGIIISSKDGESLRNTAVWLAEIVRQDDQAVYVLDSVNSPGMYTDLDGKFVISNVTPGEYVIVVGEPEGYYEIITESSGLAKVWVFPANDITDVYELKVNLIN